MHPLNLLHPRTMLTLPWHCSCVTPNTYSPTSVSGEKKRFYQVHFPWWNFRTDWTNLAPLPSVLDIGLFLICKRWRVHMIPSFSCDAISSEAETIKAASSSKLMIQSRLSKKVTSFSASHHPAHTCTQKSQHTVLQTEGLLCCTT